MADVDSLIRNDNQKVDEIDPDSLMYTICGTNHTIIDDSSSSGLEDSLNEPILEPPDGFNEITNKMVERNEQEESMSADSLDVIVNNGRIVDCQHVGNDLKETNHNNLHEIPNNDNVQAPDVLANVHNNIEPDNPDVVSFGDQKHDLHDSSLSSLSSHETEESNSETNANKAKKERKKKRKSSNRSRNSAEVSSRQSDASLKQTGNIRDSKVITEKTETKEDMKEPEEKKQVIDVDLKMKMCMYNNECERDNGTNATSTTKESVQTGISVANIRSNFTRVRQNGTKKLKEDVVPITKPPVDHRAKITKRFNVGGYDKCPCKICDKHVYPMEKVSAEKHDYHKTCFRCVQCKKILGYDNFRLFEEKLFCPNHYQQQIHMKISAQEDPAPQFEDEMDFDLINDDESMILDEISCDETAKQKKHEMIIRENIPATLPPDVVRCNDKAEEEIDHQSLSKKLRNIKSRLEASFDEPDPQRAPSQLSIEEKSPLQRSPSIMDRLAKYQAAMTNRQVSDSDSDSSDEEIRRNPDILRESHKREKVKFTRMNSLMSKWETGTVKSQAEVNPSNGPALRSNDSNSYTHESGACQPPVVPSPTNSPTVEDQESVDGSGESGHCEAVAKSLKDKFESGSFMDEIDCEMADKLRREKEEDLSFVYQQTDSTKNAREMFKEIDNNAVVSAPDFSLPIKTDANRRPRDLNIDMAESNIEVVKSDVTPEVMSAPRPLSQKFKVFERKNGMDSLNVNHNDIGRSASAIQLDLPRCDTAKKMLNKFKAMESGAYVPPSRGGPRTISYTKESSTEGDSDDSSSSEPERNPNIIRETDKSEDDVVVETDKALNLRNKFENWQTHNNKENIRRRHDLLPSSSCKNLRAKFEAIREDSSRPTGNKPPPKVNRFAAFQGEQEKCSICKKRVYALEKIEINKMLLHRTCFKCSVCGSFLRMDSYTSSSGVLYCMTHFKQLFTMKGNYDEGFGRGQHKDKWTAVKESEEISTNANGHVEAVNGNCNLAEDSLQHGLKIETKINGERPSSPKVDSPLNSPREETKPAEYVVSSIVTMTTYDVDERLASSGEPCYDNDTGDLLYENVTLIKERNALKEVQRPHLEAPAQSMMRSYASDDSLDNYLQGSEEIEDFDVDAYLNEDVPLGNKGDEHVGLF